MNAKRPAEARRKGTPARKLSKRSQTRRRLPAVEHDLRWELRGRLHACLAEIEARADLSDVTLTILEGACERIRDAYGRRPQDGGDVR
jgi:hypothetical protein